MRKVAKGVVEEWQAARFIANLLHRYRWIAYIGLAVILYVALGMVFRGAQELTPVVAALAGF